MAQDLSVYDLGEVRIDNPSADRRGSTPRRKQASAGGRSARSRPTASDRIGPGLTGSLSLFLPGSGQMLAGEMGRGLFFLTGIGFALAAAYSVVATLDSLLPTIELLGIPRAAVGATLGVLIVAAAALHVAAVVHASSLPMDPGRASPHPLVAGLASALLPGWGQTVVGHRARAALFLCCLWLIAAAWLGVTTEGLRLLREVGLDLPKGARDGWGPIVLVTAPILVWTIAIYDAAYGAVARRRLA